MVNYEQAIAIAKELKRNIDHCEERTDAYVFTSEADKWSIGGDGACVVLKENGRAINMIEYIDNHKGTKVRDFEVE